MFKAKFTALALMLMAFITNVSAQNADSKKTNAASGPVSSNIEIKGNEQWAGYFNGSFNGTGTYDDSFSLPSLYDAAIKVPASSWMLTGKTVEGIRFSFKNSGEISNVKVWISSTLPSSPEKADIVCDNVNEITGLQNNGAVNEVRFSKPYKSDGKTDIYIGYSFKNNGWDPILYQGRTNTPDAFWLRVDGGEWNDMIGKYPNGILAMEFLISSDSHENAATMSDNIGSFTTLTGNEVSVPVTIENDGSKGISSLGFTIDINGVKTTEEVTLDKKVEAVGDNVTHILKVTPPAELGAYDIAVSVDKVNGVANEHEITGKGKIYVVSKKAEVIPFVEEFTGIWCTNCPIGTVGLERLRQDYGDKVNLAAVHVKDPMFCPDYKPVIDEAGNLPSAHVSRYYRKVNPYLGKEINKYGIGLLVEDCKALLPAATISLKAEFVGQSITVNSQTEFLYNGDASNFAIGYIVSTDGLFNEKWKQKNSYVGTTPQGLDNEPLFDKWKNGTGLMQVEFDEVPVAVQGIYSGVDGSVPAIVSVGVKNDHSVNFEPEKLKLIQDQKNVKVIAILIDRFTGQIINSASAVPTVSTGVDEIAGNGEGAVVTARYTLDGRLINAPEKGVNIVKYSDGTVKKVIVR